MARRTNYGFEKRQKELDRQKKKEAKAEKKLLKKQDSSEEEVPEGTETVDEDEISS
jgi:hypothetical protein